MCMCEDDYDSKQAWQSAVQLGKSRAGYSRRASASVAVLAETSLRSPRKIFIFIIKKKYLLDQSIQKINNVILKKTSLASTSCQGIHDSQGSFMNNPQQIASAIKTHYAKLASPSEDPAFLDDHQLFIEFAFQNWQVEGIAVFQPELDGEFLAEEIHGAIDNLPLHKAAHSDDIAGDFIRSGGEELEALLLSLLERFGKMKVFRKIEGPVSW